MVPAVLLLVGLSAPFVLPAQTRGNADTTLSRQDMLQRVFAQFERRLARELRLTADQIREINDIMRTMREQRGELYQRRRALGREMQRFGEEEEGDEATARSILAETRAIRAEESRLESEEEARLLEILTPAQVLGFRIMREELNDRIRRVYRSDDGDRRPAPDED